MAKPPRPFRYPQPRSGALRRNRQRGRIAGICAGLEDYTGWDRILFRFLFLASLLFGGMGLWVYLLLWIALPSAPETPMPDVSYAGRKHLKSLRHQVLKIQKIHQPWLGDLVNEVFDSVKLLMPELEAPSTHRPLTEECRKHLQEFPSLLHRINQLPAEDFRHLDAEPLAQRLVEKLTDTQGVLAEASLAVVDQAFLSTLSKGHQNPHPTLMEWRHLLMPLQSQLKQRRLPEVESALNRIDESLGFLFERLEGYTSDLLDMRPHDIHRIAFDYLPDTLKEYLRLPASLARTVDIRDGATAETHLLEQLNLLDRTLHDFSRSLFAEDTRGLLIHGRFLRDKFNDVNLNPDQEPARPANP